MPAPAALALYRKLWRQTRGLPRTVKAFYQGSIRSGFVAHSDEDDPQVLQRIHAQAAKDAEWLVAKYAQEAARERENKGRRHK